MKLLRAVIIALAMLAGPAAVAADGRTWASAWYASPQPLWSGNFPLPVIVPQSLWDQTVRQTVRVGLGGERLRIVLSNAYGSRPVEIGAASVAPIGEDGKPDASRTRALGFSGQAGVSIRPGSPVVSDPVALPVAPLDRLEISFHLPHPTALETFHWEGLSPVAILAGNAVSDPDAPATTTITARPLLSQVLVEVPGDVRTVVALGDSITDGAASTPGTDSRWPDFLAARLAKENVSVVNAGISGGRLLRDLMGESALARFDRDVLAQHNVKAVVVLIGINDISWPGHVFAPDLAMPSVDEMIEGYRQLIARAHAANVRIVGATLTPFKGALAGTPFEGYHSAARDTLRQEINAWIRTSGDFDAVVDLDALLQDGTDPLVLRAEYDSGDHLHASDRGNEAIAAAVTTEILFGND
jgi:lysophospholipase L1-like esterase